jgi:hypothetical protein
MKSDTKVTTPVFLKGFWVLFIASATITVNPNLFGLKGTVGLSEIFSVLLLINYGIRHNKIPVVYDNIFKIMMIAFAYGIVVGGSRAVLFNKPVIWAIIPMFGFLPIYYSCILLYLKKYPELANVTIYTLFCANVFLFLLSVLPIVHIGNIPLYHSVHNAEAFRFKGFFRNPNQTAFFLVASYLISVIYLKNRKQVLYKYLGITTITVLSVTTILKTGSDAGYICIFLFPFIFFPTRLKGPLITTAFFSIIVIYYFLPNYFDSFFANISSYFTKSDQGNFRLTAYTSTISFLVSTFSLGSGFSEWLFGIAEVHNVILDLTLNFGVILGLYLFWIIFGKNIFYSISTKYKDYRFAAYCNVFPVLLLFSIAHLTYRQRILWIAIALIQFLKQNEYDHSIGTSHIIKI